MSQERRLLIVDDDEDMCLSLADILESKGFHVEWGKTGQEAIDKISRSSFNIVLVDRKLPDAEGTELLNTLKNIDPDVEGIVITGHASLENSVTAMEAGAFSYVTKPVAIDKLTEAIDKALQKQRRRIKAKERLAEETRSKEYYKSLAIKDGLTGLYNHRHFQELLSREIANARRYSHPLGMLMIDIDDFKKYNDSFGHPAGDEALRTISQVLTLNRRDGDLLARYGGEEFAILMPQTTKAEAISAAERLREAVERTYIGGDKGNSGKGLTISIGVANYPSDADEGGQLIMKADKALYKAKSLLKNRVCSYDEVEVQNGSRGQYTL